MSCVFFRRGFSSRVLHPETRRLGIVYVHWPYCSQICAYCNFNKYLYARKKVDDKQITKVFTKQLQSMMKRSCISKVASVYFGGGTPSLADPSLVEEVLNVVAKVSSVAKEMEVTLEANPTSTHLDKLKDFKTAGVNRLSLGVQSLQDDALQLMNRNHTAKEALCVLAQANELFPKKTNIDMIFARPGQTCLDWEKELEEVLQHCGHHLSLYQLTIEPGTPFSKAVKRGEMKLPSNEAIADMYEHSVKALNNVGLRRYEISNFAKDGAESKQNLAYWTGIDYIGIGPGAHSRFLESNASHFIHAVNELEPNSWMNEVWTSKNHGMRLVKLLSQQERHQELLATAIRTREGITNEIWEAIYPASVTPLNKIFSVSDPTLQYLCDNDLLIINERCLKATDKGLNLADSIASELFEVFSRNMNYQFQSH